MTHLFASKSRERYKSLAQYH